VKALLHVLLTFTQEMRGGYTLAQSKLNLDLRVMRTYSVLTLIAIALAAFTAPEQSAEISDSLLSANACSAIEHVNPEE
jgi:hypothetical protein